MGRPNGLVRHLSRLVVCCSICGTASVASARPRVQLGEVTTRAVVSDIGTQRLRALVERELESLDLRRASGDRRYIVSVSLVRFDAKTDESHARARCEIAATVRRADGDTLIAILRGRGAAETEADSLDEAKNDALSAAIRGAVQRVPEALR